MEFNRFTAVDVETSKNPTSTDNFICSIGIVIVENNEIVKQIEYLVKPKDNYIEKSTINIHHITPEMTQNEKTFDQIWPEIEQYFYDTTIIAHNSTFDERIIRYVLKYYFELEYEFSIKNRIPKFTDTKTVFGGEFSAGLWSLCNTMGIECDEEQHHGALYDAICAAKLYMKFLNGEVPNRDKLSYFKHIEEQNKKKFKVFKQSRQTIKKENLGMDLTNANPDSPFYGKRVVFTGTLVQERNSVAAFLKYKMGADIRNSNITRNDHFVIIGENPGENKIKNLENLKYNGFNLKVLYQKDIDDIMESTNLDLYKTEELKSLDFSIEHYEKHKISFSNGRNILYSKEVFLGKNLSGKRSLFHLILGNLGAFGGEDDLSSSTQICILSNSTILNLAKGIKDDTIKKIESFYNTNRSILFDFNFISEDDILKFCKERCEICGDELTLGYYNTYLDSAVEALNKKQAENQSKKSIYKKINGKYVISLEDERTWCPSRQMRGDNYNLSFDKDTEK